MRRLILAKHARPEMRADVPASRWHLSVEGIASSRRLGERFRSYAPRALVSSTEPKALETAAIVADALGLPLETAPGLHDHERPALGFLGEEEFQRRVAALFAQPDELLCGVETSSAALRRFSNAIDRVVADRTGDIAIVTHGTVVSLFIAARARQDGNSLWSRLGLPSFVVVELPSFAVIELVSAL